MKISFESELMENQKHALVMAPGLAFEVLQSQDGDALFFSIGTDNIFYLTRELTQTSTGWSKIDLSSALAAQHGGAAVAAKSFSVAQNPQTLGIDLALVLTVGGADFLYLSLDNANTDAAWANGVNWTVIPFDAGTAPNPLTITEVLLMNIPATGGGGAVENIFVYILHAPGDPFNFIDRYYIVPGGAPQWNPRSLGANLSAGSISSSLGQRTGDPVPGIYTFGTIDNEPELNFIEQYNYFMPKSAPSVARLPLPAGASAIASALNDSGVSNLFVAGTDGLFLFTPDNQHGQAPPVQIISSSLIAGASVLAAATDANRTAVWGLDPQGNLFYVICPAGSEADSTAWSDPLPLITNAEGFAFFLNLNAGNNVLFAHVDGQSLIQLTQDPVTTDWLQRSILLPSTDPDDVAVYNSFTTHIQITDDNGIGAPDTALAVTATSPVSVYLNDTYFRLSPTVAVQTTADATGVLTVVQETQSLAGVCFRVTLTDTPEVVADVNPMSKALATLGTIQNGADLGNVQVTNSDGTQQPLVPSAVSANDKDVAAQSIAQFVKINASLPPDGSRQAPVNVSRLLTAAPDPAMAVPGIWGVSFATGGMEYHVGENLIQHFGLQTVTAAAAASLPPGAGAPFGSIASDFDVAAGDFFRWVKHVVHEVESFVVHEAEGLYHFVATIAGKVYHVLLDCIDAVAHAVEFVFNKIKVFFEDLIKWVGFIFNWSDILRTHNVLKNIFNQYLAKCINNLGTFRGQLQQTFTDAENYIAGWAGIPANIPQSLSGASLNGATGSSQQGPGQGSPQSNWGIHHLKSNAASGNTTAQPNKGVVGDIESVLQPLADALDREKDIFKAARCSFKCDVIDKIHTLTFAELIKAVVAIIADALIESVENVLLTALDVLIALAEGVLDVLNEPINIPVISWLYKKVAQADLSLLDLTCLIAAIPVTIGYKLITDAAPFPDDATTSALIEATDFAGIQKICNPPPSLTAAPNALTASISIAENNKLVLAGGIMSVVGATVLTFTTPPKLKDPTNKALSVVNGIFYLNYVSPDIMGQIPDLQDKKWWAVTNETISDLMAVKAMIDMCIGLTSQTTKGQKGWNDASPWLDFGGNILWQVPTTAALFDPENQTDAGILNYFAGTCFDCNGILSPAMADTNGTAWAAIVILAGFFNLAYGAMSCAASVLTFKS